MPGKRRLKGRRVQRTARHRAVEVVDAHTLTVHFLTADALATGRHVSSRYVAICGQDVVPASLVEPGRGRYRSCTSIPMQRSRS